MSMSSEPVPRVVRCEREDVDSLRLTVMCLEWTSYSVLDDQEWHLPDGIRITSSLPTRFGMILFRHGEDSYELRLIWNQTNLTWRELTRQQLLDCCLTGLLRMLGSDLSHMVDQPILDTPLAAV